MEYKKINKTSYNIHLIKTDKFKTIDIRGCFRDEIRKEDITLRNMLSSLMTYSTDTYPTKRDLVLKSEDLYAATIFTKSYRSGRFSLVNFYLSMLNEKYTEKGMYEESIKFLSDVIFNPNFNKEKEFNDAYKFLYESANRTLKGLKENGGNYSTIRVLEEIDDNPYSYRDVGYMDDLKKINLDSLKEYYNKLITSSLVDIIVIGDINDDIVKLIEKYFDFKTFKRPKIDPIITHDKFRQRVKSIKEENDASQSKLSIACKIGKLTTFERNFVLNVYNAILGGSSESKFFQIIREKNSLAYYVYSSINKLDSLMLIRAGISKDNYDKTISLIKKLMKEVEDGKFTLDDIKVAQENYISSLNEVEDSSDGIVEAYLANELLGLGDLETRKKEIMKVTKEDVMKVAKKIKLDTIFLLEGVDGLE